MTHAERFIQTLPSGLSLDDIQAELLKVEARFHEGDATNDFAVFVFPDDSCVKVDTATRAVTLCAIE